MVEWLGRWNRSGHWRTKVECRFRFAVAGGRPSGCYLLVLKGVVVYVGKSENVFTRVAQHWRALQRRKVGLGYTTNSLNPDKIVEFDSVELIPVPLQGLNREELRLIQIHQPKHNVLLKRQQIAPGLEEKEAFKELLTKKKQSLRIRKLTNIHV